MKRAFTRSPWLNLALFALTVWSTFETARTQSPEADASWVSGWTFALPLLAILLAHEFGHYFAARAHGVPASLPYFIPVPYTLLGTFGAIIFMPPRIRSRTALLDIGAAGPLAGLVVAIPVLWLGLTLSPVLPQSPDGYLQEGQSLLYAGLKWLVHGSIPPGYDVQLHPTAFAGWAGLLVTLINLVPWSQLDGGHIAYALLGPRQARFGVWARRAMLLAFVGNAVRFLLPVVQGTSAMAWWVALLNSSFWLQWWGLTWVLGRVSGSEHPPVQPGPLPPGRQAIAWLCLALLVLLAMPTPLAEYPPEPLAKLAAQSDLDAAGHVR